MTALLLDGVDGRADAVLAEGPALVGQAADEPEFQPLVNILKMKDINAKLFSYVVDHDYGYAPCPFGDTQGGEDVADCVHGSFSGAMVWGMRMPLLCPWRCQADCFAAGSAQAGRAGARTMLAPVGWGERMRRQAASAASTKP
jgi:hypothetical protein